MEALIRWQHPQWGWVQPSEFIPIAEDCGLIVQLTKWVITEATRQAADWRRRLPDGLPRGIAVNVTARDLSQESFVDFVEATCREQGAEPSDLTFEITERTFLDETNRTISDNLLKLADLGANLSIDDFGTGYSSLASLERFPFTSIKIDRIFIRSITSPTTDTPIVRAVTELAHALKIEVIAEGVETSAQADLLRKLRCDSAQGYHFARPQTADKLDDILLPAETAIAQEVALRPA